MRIQFVPPNGEERRVGIALMGTPCSSVAAAQPALASVPARRRPQTARLGPGGRAWLYEPVRSRLFAGLLVAAFVLAACGGGGGGKSNAQKPNDPNGLSAETASFDLAAGPPGRYLIGLFTNDQRGVSFGSIQVQFCFLGATKVSQPCQLGAPVTATFLPTPGTQVPPDKTAPEVISPSGP